MDRASDARYLLPTAAGAAEMGQETPRQQLMCLLFGETAEKGAQTVDSIRATLRADIEAGREGVQEILEEIAYQQKELAGAEKGLTLRQGIEDAYYPLIAKLLDAGSVRLLDPSDPGDV